MQFYTYSYFYCWKVFEQAQIVPFFQIVWTFVVIQILGQYFLILINRISLVRIVMYLYVSIVFLFFEGKVLLELGGKFKKDDSNKLHTSLP